MTQYRSNGTPAGFAPVCEHEDQRGNGATWVCDDCGAETPKTEAQVRWLLSLVKPAPESRVSLSPAETVAAYVAALAPVVTPRHAAR